MTRVKRMFAFVLCLVFIVSALTVPAAAKTHYIDTFSKSSKWENSGDAYKVYDTLRTGKITVEKYKGSLCYKFTKNSTVVYVKPSAFTSSVSNDYSSVNKKLTNSVNKSTYSLSGQNVYYKERATQKVFYKPSRSKTLATTMYKTYLTCLEVSAGHKRGDIITQCEKHQHVEFSYKSKILSGSKLKTPSTASELKSALSRSTSNNVTMNVTPTFTVAVNKSGANKVKLETAVYYGKGIEAKTANVTDIIDVAITVGEITVKSKLGSVIPWKDLYGLYKDTNKLVKKSGEYTNNKSIKLAKSQKKHNCQAARYESPVKLKTAGDYFKVVTEMNTIPSFGKSNPTQFSIIFSAK